MTYFAVLCKVNWKKHSGTAPAVVLHGSHPIPGTRSPRSRMVGHLPTLSPAMILSSVSANVPGDTIPSL